MKRIYLGFINYLNNHCGHYTFKSQAYMLYSIFLKLEDWGYYVGVYSPMDLFHNYLILNRHFIRAREG